MENISLLRLLYLERNINPILYPIHSIKQRQYKFVLLERKKKELEFISFFPTL